MRYFLLFLSLCCFWVPVGAEPVRFSTAGFYAIEGSPRVVASMNAAWRVYVGDASNGHLRSTDDKSWRAVNVPDGLHLLPYEASGGVNYRGAAWYRKSFTLPSSHHGKRLLLYFEAVMGKSKIWVNEQLVGEHFGGYTPIPIDITSYVNLEGENLIAVRADNSDDPIYPPGKAQNVLDFCYFGGIYRDVWLVGSSPHLFITDPNQVDKQAGGGVAVWYEGVGEKQTSVYLKVDVAGSRPQSQGSIQYRLISPEKKVVAQQKKAIRLGDNLAKIVLTQAQLWSPEAPNLYRLEVELRDEQGRLADSYALLLGIRSIEFTPAQGLVLNGKPYPRKLIGANRHQDFAIVGNALSNSLHWRDAAKLKGAGFEVIRNAHYPQDPAFMDACDQLGLFVIVNTPGWQFWNKEPIFEQRVYSDIRAMVRRDRSRASVLLWEPILNETHYPEQFALNTHLLVKAESPWEGTNYTAADMSARGSQYFDVIFAHPKGSNEQAQSYDPNKVYFTREFGDNVVDWNSQNSPSRVARNWGEQAQLIQSVHYVAPPYAYTCYEVLENQPPQHFGGTLWHSFDHQRGYHPEPFYGGIMDAFRRPKYAYQMFRAQTERGGAMVFIANELSVISPQDITVFSNCHSVRLTTFVGSDTVRLEHRRPGKRWFIFPKAWDYMADKALSGGYNQLKTVVVAEGLDRQGRVVAVDRRYPARRPAEFRLLVDTMGCPMVADGSDMVVVTAQIVDKWGNVKRLSNQWVRFSIEGQGVILADPSTQTNPLQVAWGEASVLVRSTTTAGKVVVRAEALSAADHTPMTGQVEFLSARPTEALVFRPSDLPQQATSATEITLQELQKRKAIEQELLLVEKQQFDFGEQR